MSTTCMWSLKKIHWKLWEELITQTVYRKVWRTDRQEQILMPPDYRHGGIKTLLKVNLYTFRESISAIFVFASFLYRGQLLKEIICSLWSKFFPLKVDLILGELRCPGRQTVSHKSYSPLKRAENMMVFSYNLFYLQQLYMQEVPKAPVTLAWHFWWHVLTCKKSLQMAPCCKLNFWSKYFNCQNNVRTPT